ncbi:glycoside hydrolase family 15 protein [Candidatus Bipolaricaulota bacterium]|nr:glycoside hydrolase family 15 protein [Candidatus Bipolaricaulota bacterium]
MVDDSYLDIGDYAIIGNLETIALVGKNGSIDWFPVPHMESPSVFARILDSNKGGGFSIAPTRPFDSHQNYISQTNVLKTTFQSTLGTVSVTDYMPIYPDEPTGEKAILRKVAGKEGATEIGVDFRPRFDYARTEPRMTETRGAIEASAEGTELTLESPIKVSLNKGSGKGSFEVKKGEEYWFSLEYGNNRENEFDYQSTLARTKDYWRDWAHDCEEDSCVFRGPWHELIVRSGLVLKLLTHPETGAIAAAPTTSLPEEIGGVRNWDYRFAWIRDASMTIQSLYNLGHEEEASNYFGWLRKLSKVHQDPSELQIMYSLHGKTDLKEEELEHLSGYRNSSPVRVGNAASDQKQLDIYGELINAFYETCPTYGEEIRAGDWEFILKAANHVTEVWREKDAGIWEVRGEDRHFLYSKLMCWVALDRAIKIGEGWEFEGPFGTWRKERSKIRKAILEQGYDEEAESFVQSFGSRSLDATSLLVPLVGFLPPDDRKVENTLETTIERLTSRDGLVYRYDGDDGLEGEEGAFLLCSFWLVRALTAAGRTEEAREYLKNITDYANPVGLLAEEVDPSTGKQLGNFPQAFSHIGLINSGLFLGQALGREINELSNSETAAD